MARDAHAIALDGVQGLFGLNSAGQSPTLLVYKTVHESLPFTRLLNSLVIVIHASRGFGHGTLCAAAPDSPVYDSLDSCPHGGPPFGHLGRNTVRSEDIAQTGSL